MVTFHAVENWVIGEDNAIKYVMPFELEDAGNDWVGVFKVSVCLTLHYSPRFNFKSDCLF